MDACKHSSTKVQVARARTSTGQHRTRTPRALGSQDATPAPLPGAPSGMRAMARGAASQTPGDHATNLGATMLVLLRMAPLAYFRGRLGTL